MKSKRDWLREPIVFLPLTFALVFFLSLPFFLFGTEGAPAFYGAFFAAITGLAGVVVGALYNAQKVRERDDRLARLSALAAVRMTRMELERVISSLQLLKQHQFPPRPSNEEDGVTAVDQEFHSLHNMVDTFLLTPAMNEHISVLCMQSLSIAKPIMSFISTRENITSTVIQAVEMRDKYAGKALPTIRWSYVHNSVNLLLMHAGAAVKALNEFEGDHAKEFA
jgi:hypothetical protein